MPLRECYAGQRGAANGSRLAGDFGVPVPSTRDCGTLTTSRLRLRAGQLHRLDRACGARVCQRGGEVAKGAVQAPGAADPRAVRARPRGRRRLLSLREEAEDELSAIVSARRP
eukprot:2542116-Prymnesium_polylepis.1